MQYLLIQAQSLQNLLISRATGGITSANERESHAQYLQLRQLFITNKEFENTSQLFYLHAGIYINFGMK